MAIDERPKPSTFTRFCYGVTAVSSLIGGMIGVGGSLLANGAPQQAAAAGLGCLFAVGPYVFARAAQELGW